MIKPATTSFSRYVRRVMKEKGLTQREVELRSGGRITDGYVGDILGDRAKNPSVEKIKALARGLGVDSHELFDIACGPIEGHGVEARTTGWQGIRSFLETMREVANNPDLISILEELVQLRPEERAVMLQSLESLNGRGRKVQRRKRSR